MLFYHPEFNILRLLYPNGKVEFLSLNPASIHKKWETSYLSGGAYEDNLKLLSIAHDLIGLV